jgi:hypothetical protein
MKTLNSVKRVNSITPKELNVKHAVKHTHLYFTVNSLQQLQDAIEASETKLYQNRKTNRRIREDNIEPATVVRSKPLIDIVEKYGLDVPVEPREPNSA